MEAFYLKYRPRAIRELDNRRIRHELEQILQQPQLPHAFLFIGPKGIGKTSTARILAKALACPHRRGLEPCNKCSVCRASDRGTNLDIIEIDAASNRGIDDIRRLREQVNLAPLQSANKIYIIDEVHMLTNEAFNAILKTLEEPPEHVYFVFCTTNPEKIPETVLSRLTTLRFQRATEPEIETALQRAIKGEHLKIGKKALHLLATAADGSFRDAHKLLYQLYLSEGKRITFAAAEKRLGRWLTILPREFLRLILTGEIEKALAVTRELEEKQVDFEDYLHRCLQAGQQLLFWRLGVEKPPEEVEINWLAEQPPDRLARLLDNFTQALRQEKEINIPALPLQLLVAGWEPGGAMGVVKPHPEAMPMKAKLKTAVPEPTVRESAVVNYPQGGDAEKLAMVKEKWPALMAAVKPMNHSVVALLKACRPIKVEGHKITLGVFYPFHRDRLAEERNRRIVETGLAKALGGRWQIACILTPKGDNKKEPGGGNGDDLYAAAKEIFG